MNEMSTQYAAYLIPLALGVSLLWKIIQWRQRVNDFGTQMPVVPVLFPPTSLYRRFWPKTWQTFHAAWQVRNKRKIYHKLGSDNFAFVCLFEYDEVYLSDPAAVVEMKVKKADRFPRDMTTLKKVRHLLRC